MDESYDRLDQAHKLVYNFMKKNNVEIEDYSYLDLFSSIINEYEIEHENIDFGDVLGSVLSGVLVKGGDQWFIHINKQMYSARQNFTRCHELSHFIWDCKFGQEVHQFQSLINNEFASDNGIERLADNSAGVMMLPDICIKYALDNDLTAREIMNKYKISNTALKVRLLQFFSFHINLPISIALDSVMKFIHENEPKDVKFYLNFEYLGMPERVQSKYDFS